MGSNPLAFVENLDGPGDGPDPEGLLQKRMRDRVVMLFDLDMPNRTFIVRQVWMAASLQAGCRPRLPVGLASHVISGSDQIVSGSRRFSASL